MYLNNLFSSHVITIHSFFSLGAFQGMRQLMMKIVGGLCVGQQIFTITLRCPNVNKRSALERGAAGSS